MAPDDASTIEDVVMAIIKLPQGGTLLVFGDFNANLVAPEGREWNEGIESALTEEVLEDMSGEKYKNVVLYVCVEKVEM